ncbi:MAG: ATP-binding cassette domain-containing protein [Synergistaceae bacterium]|nr:ATP-binding cassette domain-containing protein [Synergistaceae bacterium]
MIELEHIVKSFHADKADKNKSIHAVNDVSLSINDGDIFGIIGFSGAGKSTLVRCINLLERPDSGSVKIDGVEMMTLKPKELYKARTKIGMIFQQFNLMPSRTVLQNVAYPLRNMTREQIHKRVTELLSLVDIPDKENAYPSELSGGQKQRVAIARALANDPTILLCDEATSALDPQTTGSILQLLKDLNKKLGLTIVVITHEMEVVKNICRKAAVMDAGKIIESGDVFEIFSSPKHPVTKNFVRTTSNLSKIETLINDDSPIVRVNPGQLMARLIYVRADVSEPLISYASRAFDIEINIVLADVEIVAGAMIGGTVVIFSGNSEKIDKALKYYRDKNIRVEVIKDARITA